MTDPLPASPPAEQPGPLPNGAMAAVQQFRLETLEQKVTGIEDESKKLVVQTTEIKAKMPTQAMVYGLFAGAVLVNFLALLGHLMIRSFSSP